MLSFHTKYPDIEFELIIENTNIIVQKLKNFTLDIGLIEGITPSF